jgi:hypothetical protein
MSNRSDAIASLLAAKRLIDAVNEGSFSTETAHACFTQAMATASVANALALLDVADAIRESTAQRVD